ncbi:hypothetical protein ASPNIDRAFT_40564 [Aspergillus niger ATCC 1015]|uniref:Uncharacterized protein n=1 Tax=Aspergillus niger (strain ATCC 1015 / CBS 113.46 / FGSC A1144 / LSHB Ac4 / NCTC 3858a / NRRL 328 / USDA 3528.7) TaxID=380704 RepID=G3XY32_ASPNA|nr:hypothetical protein ASPNIDRAFT_40564 [Aspergillus niger ATCC 1015]
MAFFFLSSKTLTTKVQPSHILSRLASSVNVSASDSSAGVEKKESASLSLLSAGSEPRLTVPRPSQGIIGPNGAWCPPFHPCPGIDIAAYQPVASIEPWLIIRIRYCLANHANGDFVASERNWIQLMTLGAWKPFSKVQALFLSLLGYLHDEETRLVIGRPTGRGQTAPNCSLSTPLGAKLSQVGGNRSSDQPGSGAQNEWGVDPSVGGRISVGAAGMANAPSTPAKCNPRGGEGAAIMPGIITQWQGGFRSNEFAAGDYITNQSLCIIAINARHHRRSHGLVMARISKREMKILQEG